jgi:hypothetical protein
MDAASRIAQVRERAKQQQLVVLVWGPGDPGPKGQKEILRYWRKRLDIREFLKKEFKQSEIEFSESDALRDHTRDLDALLTEELVHAAVADCILVLDVSRGAHVEVDRFSTYPAVAKKLRVLLPEKYVGGSDLVSQVLKGLTVIGFTEEEFKKCTLASDKAVKIVESVAIEKLMASSGLPQF